MKIHLVLAENWKSMQDAVKASSTYFAPFGVTVTTERKAVDISRPEVYETTSAWSKLILGKTKSLASAFIYGTASAKEANVSDCIGLLIDKAKALYEDDDLAGQHSTFGVKEILEIYCKGGKKKRYGEPDDTYVLKHEIFHALADYFGVEDGLHAYLDKNPKNLDAYKWEFLAKVMKNGRGLYPAFNSRLDLVIAYAASIGDPIVIHEAYRTPELQQEYYDRKDGTTKAKAWESMHQYRIAADYRFVKEPLWPAAGHARWKRVNDFAESIGLYSYGNKLKWDYGHLQLTYDYAETDVIKGKVDWSRYFVPLVASVPKSVPVPVPALPKVACQLNDRNVAVTSLQTFLVKGGFLDAGNVTGFYGEATAAAVLWYQLFNHTKFTSNIPQLLEWKGESWGAQSIATLK